MKSLPTISKSSLATLTLAATALAVGISAAQADIVFDMRATGATGGATLSGNKLVNLDGSNALGSTVTFTIFAVLTGADNLLTNETFNQAMFAARSAGVGGTKNIKGNFSNPVLTPGVFDQGAKQVGNLVDINGDGDIDLGSTVTNAIAGYIIPLSTASRTVLDGGSPVGLNTVEFALETFTFTVTGVLDNNSLVKTSVNTFIPTLTAALNAQRALYKLDNVSKTGSSAPIPISGADVLVQLSVPEPSAFGMLALGALGLVGFRRMGLRRAS